MGSKERREREKEARKKEILDAARMLLFEKGINAASMNQIAKASELSVGTLYLYFKNKEELFAILQEEGLDLLHGMIHSAMEEGQTPRQTLLGIADAYLEFSQTHRSYYEIINYFLTSPEVAFPPHLKKRIDENGRKILSIVEKVLMEDRRDETGVKGNGARRMAIVFWSTVHGMLHFRKLQDTILAGEDFKLLFRYGVETSLNGLIGEENA